MCIHTHPHTHVHTEICLLSSAAQQALGPQRRIKAASKLSGKKRRCYIPPATFCRITENVFNGAAELYISTLLVKKKKKERKKNSTSTQSSTALQSKALYPRWHCINCDGLWRKHIYIKPNKMTKHGANLNHKKEQQRKSYLFKRNHELSS